MNKQGRVARAKVAEERITPTTGRRWLWAAVAGICAVHGAGIAHATDSISTWIGDPSTTADWAASGNWSGGIPGASSVAYINNGGTAQCGTGSTVTIDYLDIGDSATQSGALTLSGTSFTANTAEYVGYYGTGQVVQTAGTNTFGNGGLYLGCEAGGSGTYQLSGTGVLTVAPSAYAGSPSLTVGYGGTGTFIQNGGTVSLGIQGLYIAGSNFPGNAGGTGTYQLQAGQVSASSLVVGYGGQGTFTQTGGTVTLTTALRLSSSDSVSSGLYQLSGGQLSAPEQTVGFVFSTGVLPGPGGVGTFKQTGGTNTGNYLTITSQSLYQLSGGTLQLSQGLSNNGTLDFAGGAASLNVGGLANFARGSLLNTQQATITSQPGSLLIFPAGFNPYQRLASYQPQGLTHIAGTPLSIDSTGNYTWRGDIDDPVNCAGTISAVSGQGLNLNMGLSLSGNGNVNLGSGTLDVENSSSGISGGQFAAAAQYVGQNGTGSFTQTGGTSTISGSLTLGANAGATGTYLLSGGQVSTASTAVGTSNATSAGGTGSFIQTGGVHSTNYLSIGSGSTYQFSGGTLQYTQGLDSRGTFDMAHAPVTFTAAGLTNFGGGSLVNTDQATLTGLANSLIIFPAGFDYQTSFKSFSTAGLVHTAGTPLALTAGQGFAGNGTIDDPADCAGTITSSNLTFSNGLSVHDTGNVNCSSGTLNITGGTFNLTGGSVTASVEQLGSAGAGTVTIIQSGGTHTITDSLGLGGSGAGSNTVYQLSGGQLQLGASTSLSNMELIGTLTPGSSATFVQTGGTHRVTSQGFALLGILGGGTYQLQGGSLTADGEMIGMASVPGVPQALFVQSGGTNVVNNQLSIVAGTLSITGGSLTAGMLDMEQPTAALAFAVHASPGSLTPVAIQWSASLQGLLSISLADLPNSFSSSQTLLLMQAGSPITGSFLNAPSGSRLTTSDGLGSFLVSYGTGSPYGADDLVLSDFQSVPEPGIATLLLPAGMLLSRRRRS